MNLLDWLILAFILLFVVVGYKRTLKREFVPLLAVLFGIYAAIKLIGPMNPAFTFISSSKWLTVLGFILIFIVVYAGVTFLGAFFKTYLKASKLPSRLGQISGGLIGFIRGFLMVGTLLLLILYVKFPFGVMDYVKSTLAFPGLSGYGKTLDLFSDGGESFDFAIYHRSRGDLNVSKDLTEKMTKDMGEKFSESLGKALNLTKKDLTNELDKGDKTNNAKNN
ncbi:MAG: hypothetical protein IEMM0008_1788 [bacterium]|nr:MAG: hypothetical protein IEMM0008_1788 [bacterium]